jgi:hypothetical protein
MGSASDYVFDGDIAFTSEGFTRLLAATSAREREGRRGRLPRVPFRVSGNLVDGTYEVHMQEQPLTALIFLPWSVDAMVDTTGEAFEAGGGAVRSTVDWFKDLRDEDSDAAGD